MRGSLIFRCAFVWALAGRAAAQVPMEQEPHHHLVFENGALAVLEPTILAGETTLEHLHSHDNATVCITGSNMRSQRPRAGWSDPSQACNPGWINVEEYTGKPFSHAVQNAGAGVFHLVAVENLRASGWSTNPPLSALATVLAKETRAFQIYDVKLDNRSPETSHVHGMPTIMVLISGDVTAGKQRLDQPGRWILIPAGEPHRLSTQREAKMVEIEVR
jgi:quercetin dioxygenase-like cupin family protein